eukprot:Gb_07968 [translate_table: standard]
MTALVARTGRHQQRYEEGYRLVAGSEVESRRRRVKFVFKIGAGWFSFFEYSVRFKILAKLNSFGKICVGYAYVTGNVKQRKRQNAKASDRKNQELFPEIKENFLFFNKCQMMLQQCIWKVETRKLFIALLCFCCDEGKCIPYRYRGTDDNCNGNCERTLEVLMITSQSGPRLLFPKPMRDVAFLLIHSREIMVMKLLRVQVAIGATYRFLRCDIFGKNKQLSSKHSAFRLRTLDKQDIDE